MTDAQRPIIDAWANPPFGDMSEHLPEISRLFQQAGSPPYFGEGLAPGELIALMDAADIECLFITAWHRPGVEIASNERVHEFIRDYPDRLFGIASVDLEHPLKAVGQLDRAVREYGFKALRVISWLWKLPPNNKLFYPLYVKCVELGVPFCTQVGHTGPLMPSETGRPIPYIDEVALTFPELVIVGGHIGYPWTDEMIALAWKHANVYIDTSAYLPRYYPPQLLHFMNSYGQDKVLFGTNFPMLPLDKCAQQALELELKPAAKTKFLAGNARRVFGIG